MPHNPGGMHCGIVVKPQSLMLASHVGISSCPDAPFPIQLLAKMPREAVEDGPSVWIPDIHVGDPDETPNSSLSLSLLPFFMNLPFKLFNFFFKKNNK